MTAILADWLWQPVFSPQHIFGASAVLAFLAVFAYARTFRDHRLASLGLLAMRLAVIAALAVLLMGPSKIPPVRTGLTRPKLSILADTSSSMLTADSGGAARLAFAQRNWLSDESLLELSKTYDVQYFGFDDDLRPLSRGALRQPAGKLATGRVSRIAECIRKALGAAEGESSDSALLVLSDGHDSLDTPMQPVALLARARGVPIHTVCLGGQTLQRDIILVAVPEQEFLLAGETGHILAKVHQAGLSKAGGVLHLRCGGQDVTSRFSFDGKETLTLRLPVRQDKTGMYEYRVSVDPVEGETELANNAQSVFLEVTDQEIKVLVLEGEPYWDTKFLAQSLRKDARIRMTQITQLSQLKREKIVTRGVGGEAKVPETAKQLAEYDVIILGRGVEHLLEPRTVQLLPEFVSKQGGHVVFARGRAYDPNTPLGRQMGRELAVLEPVIWGRGLVHNMSLSVTPSGRSSPCFAFAAAAGDVDAAVASLPGFTVMPVVEREKAATIVLARAMAPGRAHGAADSTAPPALVSMNYGRGSVVAVLGEGLWRWSFLPPKLARLDGAYDAFWSGMIRRLAMESDFLPGQEVSLKLSRSSIRLGDPTLLDVVCKFVPPGGFDPKLAVTGPDGKALPVVLNRVAGSAGRLQAPFAPPAAGVYTARLECPQLQPGKIERKFSVYDVDFERLETSARPDEMRTLAEQSGGKFLPQDKAQAMPEELAKLRALHELPRQPDFIWDRGALLAILLVWAGVEWLARRKAGLL